MRPDGEGHQFVDRHAGAEQVPDGDAGFPWNADEERDGREDDAKDFFQTRGEPCDVVMNAAENAVEKRDKRNERDEHGTHVKGEMKAVGGAFRDRAEEVFFLLSTVAILELHFGGGGFRRDFASAGEWNSVSGTSIFAIRMVPGAVMMTALEQIIPHERRTRCMRP